ncbi:pilus assembly protein [Aquipseudomonas alcaligenes]|uniref:pilus assembly protein n=1 Tax=Aquipseudomonas alcaligenes TaxID=43263 RepID=UPI0035B3E819
MRKPINKSLQTFLGGALASSLILSSALSYADDTEIFFGGSAIDEGIRPNVLFILDDSGSMQGTRLAQLKSAFSSIITNAGPINVGVMALNTKTNSSRLLSPVKYIDEPLNVKLSSPAIKVSGDDATRQTTSPTSTNTGDSTLIMGYVTPPGGGTISRSLGSGSTYTTDYASYYVVGSTACSAKIAAAGVTCPAGTRTTINARSGTGGNDGLLLFRNLNVPKGVTLTGAKLVLTRQTNTAAPAFSIKLENTKTAAAFNNDSSIDDRDFGNSALNTTSITPTLAGNELTFNLLSNFNNLRLLAPSSNPIGDVAIRIRATSDTSYNWFLGDGSVDSPRLELTWSGAEAAERTLGLRFQEVAIPKGATVTSARIDFVPAASDDRPVTFAVTAQNAADAGVFSAGEDFSGRAKTAATVNWSPAEWRTESPSVHVEGPNVTSLVQSVIDSNSDWCGNNSMAFFFTPTSGSGSRTMYSFDAAKNLQPVLNVTYTGGDSGCLNPILNISVADGKDDARQYRRNSSSTTFMNLTESSLAFGGTNYSLTYIGARYQKLPIRNGATVLEAQLLVTADNTNSGTATVHLENTGNSAAFTSNSGDLSGRSRTTGTSCSFAPSAAEQQLACSNSNIRQELQALFARPDWADGNSLSVILRPTADSNLALKSYESSPASSIQLRVKLQFGSLGTNIYTVRDYTNGIVQGLKANGVTPLVPTIHEAAGYFTQLPSKHFGPDSPITSACQSNYLVLLTDGEANGWTPDSQTGITSLTGSSCTGDAADDDEKCGRSAIKWLHEEDQATFESKNTVTTHTIGFNTSNNAQATRFLNDLARLGGGTAYQANNASDLAAAFDQIVQEALATNTTFVNASAPVNSFNRADNLDELYFALFRPTENDRWPGNLKRYRLKIENGTASIVDADGAAAINPTTGFFKSNARSFWSATQDGDDIAKGGAALKLPIPTGRKLLTYYGPSPSGSAVSLNNTAYELKPTNSNITKTMLGNPSMSDTDRSNLLNYIRGLDTDNTTARYALGDPIHSTPRLVTFGCSSYSNGVCTDPDQSAILGTNEGFLQSFNTDTGVEEFAFMPEVLLKNIKQLRDNARSTSAKPRLYGMDNTPTIWVNDANKNGVIYGDPTTSSTSGLNSGEFVYAYATMRRGGRNIYALDITDRNNPKLLWQIEGGVTPGFTKLSETWSAPVKTKIKIGSTITDVLIFGGGYDADQDSATVRTADDTGNAIYIVNARTGALIWSASNSAGHTQSLSSMQYSIPSPVRVIDIQKNANNTLVLDEEQLADQFFVGDMGGQIWRFYINNGSSGAGLITPAGTDGVFARVSGTSESTNRRFYEEPDIALLNVAGTPALTVNIGSGYRAHPLNQAVADRFYSFRTPLTTGPAGSDTTLTESNLYDATSNLVQRGSSAEKATAEANLGSTSGGWYIRLTRPGEKVLTRALTSNGVLFFNTYEPNTATEACQAAIGINRAYAVNLSNATPYQTSVSGNPDDRFTQASSGGGLLAPPQIYCQGKTCVVLKGGPSLPPVTLDMPPIGKTFWMDNGEIN